MPADQIIMDPCLAAEAAGLVYVSDEQPGIRREREGEGFLYCKPGGARIDDEATLERIRKLAIPPAWTEVWICPRADGHLQATGRDARGRKQYRYHPQFREQRESTKYGRMLEFAEALPALRARVAEHMALRGLPREKVLATVVRLLETTLIRIGNDGYARENRSYGLTTLRNRHVKVQGAQLRFEFEGKSGRTWRLQVGDRRIARVVRACQELPGQLLFQYHDEAGELRQVSSADVNDYLREISGRDITAKDFRTWAGTVMAALALQEVAAGESRTTQRGQLKAAIEQVAARLGNTPAICRKCYVHPEVLGAFDEGALQLRIVRVEVGNACGLSPEEAAVLALLRQRLGRTLRGDLARSLAVARKRGGTRRETVSTAEQVTPRRAPMPV
jgi:DNA topoisomerase I